MNEVDENSIAMSCLTALINENTARTTFRYDVMDRLIEQINFDGRTQPA